MNIIFSVSFGGAGDGSLVAEMVSDYLCLSVGAKCHLAEHFFGEISTLRDI